jgi:predicted secreted protein
VPRQAKAQSDGMTVTATGRDNGGEVVVPAGGVVRLASNRTTGYSWSVDPNTSRLLKLQGKPRYQSPEDAAPGTPGHQVFRFLVAEQPGADADLTLLYNPPGNRRQPRPQRFSVTVRIRRNAP